METPPLIPVSYLNAYAYCPRRFFLEHNRGMFEDNVYTVEGRSLHRVVDGKPGTAAKEARKGDVIHRRSVMFSSARLGITGKLDLLEEKPDDPPYPVEYKKGKKPPKGFEPWLNDKIQLCAQVLLMRDNGLESMEKGYLYYIQSRARVEVPITPDLIAKTLETISECAAISRSDIPPPLAENRNKCFGCSLNAICLPEEEEVCKGAKANAKVILPMRMDGDLLYVDVPGAYVGLSSGNLDVTGRGGEKLGGANLETLKEVVACGPVQLTTQAIHECLKRNIPVHYLNYYGRYVGSSFPMFHFHGILREAQWRTHFDENKSLDFARIVVDSKIRNIRTLMMRYLKEDRSEEDNAQFDQLKSLCKKASRSEDGDSLRGVEGAASRTYFGRFAEYIKPAMRTEFPFDGRNRRPPRDPVNAMLSFGYALLAKDAAGAAIRVGFDPFCGFFHSMKYGRPSLALDMMEFFRQPIVDSTVISAINNGVFKKTDFIQFQNVCYLNEKGRKKFLAQYEMRKKDMITHPQFHYRLSYERTIELQYRLLGKYMLKEIDNYEGFYIR
jgi:CRISP-associated protein Cas1